jgi:2'-hydroxyisoflavone reductase
VSSISAYADLSRPGVAEDAPLAELDKETEDRDEAYGPLKALCERAVQDIYGERATVVRPGLIVGPWDPTGRFTYWPVRIAAGGDVLAPEPRDAPVQVIDVRDLADWMVRLVEEDRGGVFNATGPEQSLTLERLLESCRTVTRSNARLVWVASERLVKEGVREWIELPLWLTDPTAQGVMQADVSRARAAGLRFRPLARTIADTLQWAASGGSPGSTSGLDRDKERRLLSNA